MKIKVAAWLKEKQNMVFLLLLTVCMAAAICACVQKAGFHEDEYYTMYSTARSVGFFVEDGTLLNREDLAREYRVMPGQKFQYGLVKLVQSWDVHPPLYYFAVHTMESLFPATLSKWHGLSVNLICHFLSLIFLFFLAKRVLFYITGGLQGNEETAYGERKITIAAATVMLLYGLSPAGLSSVTLIRMYAMLTLFLLWTVLLHVKNMDAESLSVKSFWVPLGVSAFLGFMTQYYDFLFLFFMAAAFCLYRLVTRKRIKEILQYGATMVVTFGLAYLFYPVYPSHMFSGQRGGQAANNFFDLGILWQRLTYFGGLLQKFLFAGCFWILLALLLVLAVLGKCRVSRSFAPLALMGAACLGYFGVASKTSLLVGDAALRYMMPICPLLVLLLVCGLLSLGWQSPYMKRIVAGMLFAWLLLNLLTDKGGGVLFLYPQDKERIELAEAYSQQNIPVAYGYDPYQTWTIWDSSDELLKYREIYLFEENREELTLSPAIKEADRLVLYVSTVGDGDVCLAKVLSACPNLTESRLQYEDTYCRVYLLQ